MISVTYFANVPYTSDIYYVSTVLNVSATGVSLVRTLNSLLKNAETLTFSTESTGSSGRV